MKGCRAMKARCNQSSKPIVKNKVATKPKTNARLITSTAALLTVLTGLSIIHWTQLEEKSMPALAMEPIARKEVNEPRMVAVAPKLVEQVTPAQRPREQVNPPAPEQAVARVEDLKAAAPVDSKAAQCEAMKRYPELGRYGSAFNKDFLLRMKRYQAEKPELFQNAKWPLVVANEVALSGVPIFARGEDDGRENCSHARTLLPSEPEWRFLRAYREGGDIVVPNAVATVFGWDSSLKVFDPDDNGKCASGRGTRDNPGLMGCALPVSMERRSTVGSPFPKVPWMQWFTPVVVTYNGKSITVPLIDNGPSAPKPGDRVRAGIDLTPAACLALGISLDDIRKNRVAFNVSFRLPGAGRLASLD